MFNAEGKTPQEVRKAYQEACKDINTVLEIKPKINVIASLEVLGEKIVTAISGCIGKDEQGNPAWSNPAAAGLKKETIDLYEFVVAAQATAEVQEEVQETVSKEAVETEPAPEPAQEKSGCDAFDEAEGPGEDEVCGECTKREECIQRAAQKPAGAAAKEETKAQRQAEKEQRKAEKEAAKADKETAKATKKAEKEAAKAAKKAEKEAARAAAKEAKKSQKSEGKPGVIQSIITFIDTPKTKAEIVEHLAATFPDRDKEGMGRTTGLVLKGGFLGARKGTQKIVVTGEGAGKKFQVVAVG